MPLTVLRPHPDDAQVVIDSLQAQRARLEEDLARSVAINQMWLESFAGCPVIGPCREAAEATEAFLSSVGSFT